MAYLNVMEQIRKTAKMPAMKGGVPDKDHRKCSDWGSYTDAVDTVTGDLVAQLVSCKESFAKLAGEKADMAGRIADMHDSVATSDRKRMVANVSAKAMAFDLPSSQREAFVEAVSDG